MRLTGWCARFVGLAFAVAACSGGESPPSSVPVAALTLELASGDAQLAVAGQPLPAALVVRVVRGGAGEAGVRMRYAVSRGRLDSADQFTNTQGLARAWWTAPGDSSQLLAAQLRATIDNADGASVVFSVRQRRGNDLDLVIADVRDSVRFVTYRSGDFRNISYMTREFSDSAQVYFSDTQSYNEIAAFAKNRAPVLARAGWTPGRDTIALRFQRPNIELPLTVWVIEPPFDSTMKLVRRHLEALRPTWELQAGIAFSDVRIVDATAFAGAARYQGPSVVACDADILTRVGRQADRINAYYIGQPAIGSAAYCGEGWLQVFPLAWERSEVVLAHEIGHGFLGGHHETLPNNVMHFRGDGATFSAGQRFHAHFSARSMLNSMFRRYPAEMQRQCEQSPASTRPVCPPTNFVIE